MFWGGSRGRAVALALWQRPNGEEFMRIASAVLLALLLAPAAASAQKPIRIVVPFAPGASADGIARAVATGLSERTGRPVVVENNVGGGGSLGLVALTKSPPDGDPLAVGATGP